MSRRDAEGAHQAIDAPVHSAREPQGPSAEEARPDTSPGISNAMGLAVMQGEASTAELALWAGPWAAAMGMPGLDPLASNSSAQQLMALSGEAMEGSEPHQGLMGVLATATGEEVPPALEQAIGRCLVSDMAPQASAEGAEQGLDSSDSAQVDSPDAAAQGPDLALPSGLPPSETAGPIPAMPAAPLREPDQLVDHYMEQNWDQREYQAKKAEFGMQSHLEAMVDLATPQDASPLVHSAVDLAWTLHSGMLDSLLVGSFKAIPIVGSIGHLGTTVRDWVRTSHDYGAEGANNSLGWSINQVANVVDLVGGAVGNLADGVTVLETALAGTVIGIPEAVVTAAGGAAVRSVHAWATGTKAMLAVLSVANNAAAARHAESMGEFRKAGQLRSLAHNDVLNALVNGLTALAAVGSIAAANTAPAGAVKGMAEVGENALRRSLHAGGIAIGKKNGETRVDLGRTAIGLLKQSKGGGLLTLTQGYDNLMYHAGLGDAMAYSKDGLFGGSYIDPSAIQGSGRATSLLAKARQQTIAHFGASTAALDAAPDPLWTQQVINDTLQPADPTFLDTMNTALSPTTWLVTLYQKTNQGVLDGSQHASATTYATLAEVLESQGGPMLDQIQALLEQHKPALDQALQDFADALAEQGEVTPVIREGLQMAQTYLQHVRAMGDSRAQLDALIEPLVALTQTPMDRESLGVPDWIPDMAWRPIASGIEATVGQAAAQMDQTLNTATQTFDEFVDAQLAQAERYLLDMQAALAEGGEVERLLQEGQAQIIEAAAVMADAFQNWDPDLRGAIPAAVAWLKDLEARANELLSTAQAEAFEDFLRVEGQAKVDAWRDAHGPDIEVVYTSGVPEAEMRAVDEVYRLIQARWHQKTSNLPPERERYARNRLAYAVHTYNNAFALANSGKTGQQVLQEFWKRADILAEIAAELDA